MIISFIPSFQSSYEIYLPSLNRLPIPFLRYEVSRIACCLLGSLSRRKMIKIKSLFSNFHRSSFFSVRPKKKNPKVFVKAYPTRSQKCRGLSISSPLKFTSLPFQSRSLKLSISVHNWHRFLSSRPERGPRSRCCFAKKKSPKDSRVTLTTSFTLSHLPS